MGYYEEEHKRHLGLVKPKMLKEMRQDGSLKEHLESVANQARAAEDQMRAAGAHQSAIDDALREILYPQM